MKLFDVWILLKKEENFVSLFFPSLKTFSFWKKTDKNYNLLNAKQVSHPFDIPCSFIAVLPLAIQYHSLSSAWRSLTSGLADASQPDTPGM